MPVRKNLLIILISITVSGFFFCDGVPAATLSVCKSGCPYLLIQDAINASGYGDVIEVGVGTYQENINFGGRAITVRSSVGAALTTIDGNYAGPTVTFSSGEGSSSVLEGFTITKGITGIYTGNNASPAINDCIITGNSDNGSSRGGGGIVCAGSSSPDFSNCSIMNNTSTFGNGGGLLYGGDSGVSPTFTNCTFSGNTSVGSGGGIYGYLGSSTFINCTISGNRAARGGGVASDRSGPRFINCTISGNDAGQGGGIYCEQTVSSPPVVINSIVWGNSVAGSSNEIYFYGNSAINISYSDIMDGWPGEGNINSAPRFVSSLAYYLAPDTGGNFHLRKASPCINAGTAATAPSFDIDDDPRPQRSLYDMGSDEFPSEVSGNLLANGSFEAGSTMPADWSGNNTGLRDVRTTGRKYHAYCSFRMKGSGRNKSLTQEVAASGNAYDTFTLSGWSKAKNPLEYGGPYRLEAKVFHTDGSTARYKVGFTKRTHNWQFKSRTFTIGKDYQKIVVTVRYSRQSGKAWFDAVGLVME